jgi:hypothetical protein
MPTPSYTFTAKIYKTGINWCVDVPKRITDTLKTANGFIRIRGEINGFKFTKSLVPVKDGPYRLFVNLQMMKGGNTALGEKAAFTIQADLHKKVKEYSQPPLLRQALAAHDLTASFNALSSSRKSDILKYLNSIKTEATLKKNIDKVINQLKDKQKNVRIP